MLRRPARGEVFFADFGQGIGHEQEGFRPAVVVSASYFNRSGAELVIVVPFTTTIRERMTRIDIMPPDGGLRRHSQALPEQLRSISRNRLHKKIGKLSERSLGKVEHVIRLLCDF